METHGCDLTCLWLQFLWGASGFWGWEVRAQAASKFRTNGQQKKCFDSKRIPQA